MFDAEKDAVTLAVAVTGDRKMTSRRFWRKCVHGNEAAFREELFKFRREIAAGEVPDNPGAAFTARIKPLADNGAAKEGA